VLISGGMGSPAFNRAGAAGLQVLLTGESSIQSALQAYLAGTLENNPSLVHSH
jgi:predicted Fe-Mo cluster-binding NifX family protein